MRYPIGEYLLRSYEDDDLAALVRHADNPHIARHLRDHFPQPYTRADGAAWIRHVRGDHPYIIYAIASQEELIGSISLHPKDDVYRCSGELGYWLAEDYWGRGIATRAVRAMCDIGFSRSDLRRIYACVFSPNVGSCRVLEKAGFEHEGTMRRSVLKAGQFHDEEIFALLREDWQVQRKATDGSA